MGTWGTGPFENDSAADFSNHLDDLDAESRIAVIHEKLSAAASENGYLETDSAASAVAAAAVVVAQLPGGKPVSAAYGPELRIPPIPLELRALAIKALDRVVAEDSELADLWADSADARQWRERIAEIRRPLEGVP